VLLYHVFVHPLAERVLSHIRRQELLRAGDRVAVAVSGGIDSVALLRLLLELRNELGIVLSVVHFNHKLRGSESDADEQFVERLARQYDVQCISDSDDVAGHARAESVSLETAARELRYGFFRSLLEPADAGPQGLKPTPSGEPNGTAEAVPSHEPSSLNKIVTGHTLDDQAETVLMRLIRGAGLKGLGGIYTRIAVEDDDGGTSGEIVRPLLAFRRRELEAYLREIGQTWREDATNSDESFTRNRVRKLVVPLLEKEFNPSVAENLAELAEIARGEEDYWENEVTGWMGTAVHWSVPEWARLGPELVQPELIQIAGFGNLAPIPGSADLQSRIESSPWLVMNASVDFLWFMGEPIAVQRRVIKAIGDEAGIPLEFKHVEEILRLASDEGESGKELSLPLGWKLMIHPEELLFVTPDLRASVPAQDYEYAFEIPGCVAIPEAGFVLGAQRIPAEQASEYNPDQLLSADSVTGPLVVRNWRAGDRFRPAHTKSPKKIKELLQERHVAQPERRLWPVMVSAGEIVWMRGFPVAAQCRAKPGEAAVLIAEKPLTGESAT
jgi:tRNA(Ile)-lysidine synthase